MRVSVTSIREQRARVPLHFDTERICTVEFSVYNEDSPVPTRSFCRTDWTKPKFVTKPYSEVRQESTPDTQDDNPAELGTLGADLNYDAGYKIAANQALNPDVLLASAAQNEEFTASNYWTMYPTATNDVLKLHITTGSSKYDKEKLVQKIEDIEEVPLVEAEPRTVVKAQEIWGPSVMPVTRLDISWLRTKTQFIDDLSFCLLSSISPFDKLMTRLANYQNSDIKMDTIVQIKTVDDLFNEGDGRLMRNDGTANQCFTKESAQPEAKLQPEVTLKANQASKDKNMPTIETGNGSSSDPATKPDHKNDEEFDSRFHEEESFLIINNATGKIPGSQNQQPNEVPRYVHEYKLPNFESDPEKSADVNEPADDTKEDDNIKEFKMLLDDYKVCLFKPLLLLNNVPLGLVYGIIHNLANQIATLSQSVLPYPRAMSPFLLMSDHNRNNRFNLEDSTLIVNNFQPRLREGYQLPKFKPKPRKKKRHEIKKNIRSNVQFKLLTLEEQQFYDAQPSLDDPNSTYDVLSSVSGKSLLQRVGVQNNLMFSTIEELQAKKKSHCSPPSPHHYPSPGTVTGTPVKNEPSPTAFPKAPVKPSKKKKKCQDTIIDNPVTLPNMGASLIPPRTLLPLLLFSSAPKVAGLVSNIHTARAVLIHTIDGLLGFSCFEGNAPVEAMEMLKID